MRRSSTATSFCERNVLSETEASFLSLEVNVRETDRCIQLADGFLILAEKELSAFIRAVDKLFGAEQARQAALHWIEELEPMDWPCGESIPDWRRATVGASARLGALLSGSGEPELGKRGRRFL
jgi:hypothetical protein